MDSEADQERIERIAVFERKWNTGIKAQAIDKLEEFFERGDSHPAQRLMGPGEYVRIYTDIYDMVNMFYPNNFSDLLYDEHKKTFDTYLSGTVFKALKYQQETIATSDSSISSSSSVNGATTFLVELGKRWKNHQIMNRWMSKFLGALEEKNKRVLTGGRSSQSLNDRAIQSFREHIYDPFQKQTTTSLLQLIHNHREQNKQSILVCEENPTVISTILDMYVKIGSSSLTSSNANANANANANDDGLDVYRDHYESPLLQQTKEYYSAKGTQWLAQRSTPEYCKGVEIAVQEEYDRLQLFAANSSSVSKVIHVLEEPLLRNCQLTLLENENSGLYVLFQNDQYDDIRRLFRLYEDLHEEHASLLPIADIFKNYVSTLGQDILDRRRVALAASFDKTTTNNDNNQERQSQPKTTKKASSSSTTTTTNSLRTEDPTFIQELLELNEKYLAVVEHYFCNHPLFQNTLENLFLDLINREYPDTNTTAGSTSIENNHAELLSNFCDRILKTHSLRVGEKLTGDEITQYLRKVVRLFKYIHDKDLFVDVYREQLAKRLLSNRTRFDDPYEKEMITNLKLQCGQQFTSKLEGMLNDLVTSHELSQQKQRDSSLLTTTMGAKLDVSIQILSNGFWPTSICTSPDITLPPEMNDTINAIKIWYVHKNSDRKLKWLFTQGSASVKGTFFGGGTTSSSSTYNFQVSTLQAIALLAFDDGNAFTFDQLLTRLNIGVDDIDILKAVMHPLCSSKLGLIQKRKGKQDAAGTTTTTNTADTFTFGANPNFKSKKKKISIPVASPKSSSLNTNANKRIEVDRSLAIQASIVRIMKSRKTVMHNDLLSEVLKQLHFFRPEASTIKRSIEILIDKEYLERDPDNHAVYRYLA